MLTVCALVVASQLIKKPQIEVGTVVPNVSVLDMNGQSVSLASFRGKKLILFNWASW